MRSDILTPQTDSDGQVQAIRRNDEKALERLYQTNFPRVERYVLDNNGSSEEAKDIYQEAFIAVWRNIQLDRFEARYENSLNGYIYQIARNKWVDHLRSVKRKPVVPLHDGAGAIEDIPVLTEEEEQQINSIKKNIGLLGQLCQDVLERFYYRKESMRTISVVMKWTEATARNNKYRCLQKLRELLKTNHSTIG